ncbi:MAG: protein kinase [bacterium]
MGTLKQIDDIRIFAEIHQGAAASVYKGFQASLDRVVLLKVLHPEFNEDADAVQRFEEEAKLIAKLQHPNVVSMYASNRTEGWTYFTAEFVEGLNLAELIQLQNVHLDLAWYILLETTKGLKAAHDKNMLHQDIKPSNILISHTGQVKLADFGMAGLQASPHSKGTGEIKGTLGYLSPEHILGDPLNKYSDIFSLGATFYEMLIGTAAFYGENPNQYFDSILNDDPTQYLKRDEAIPTPLSDICQKMLSKKPAERYQNCETLLRDLKAFKMSRKLRIKANDLAEFMMAPKSYSSQLRPELVQERDRQQPARRRIYPYLFLFLILSFVPVYFNMYQSQESQNNLASADVPKDSLRTDPQAKSEELSSFTPVTSLRSNNDPDLPPRADEALSEEKADNDSVEREGEGLNVQPLDSLATRASDYVASGLLKISCTPWAYVFIDEDSIGSTPIVDSLPLAAGAHTLVFKNPDFPEFQTVIEIRPDSLTQYEYSLWSSVGILYLEVNPWAHVYIDGEFRDTTPQDGPLIVIPGRHDLVLQHPKLEKLEDTFQISAGDTLNLKYHLLSR